MNEANRKHSGSKMALPRLPDARSRDLPGDFLIIPEASGEGDRGLIYYDTLNRKTRNHAVSLNGRLIPCMGDAEDDDQSSLDENQKAEKKLRELAEVRGLGREI